MKLVYIKNPGCGWCKKADPIVEELVKDGYIITTLDITKPDEAQTAQQLQAKHNAQCGTPFFLDAETGNQVCGLKDKEILIKWANGEKIPAPPPRPTPQQRPNQQTNLDLPEFRLSIWNEAKQILQDKFYNDYEVWTAWQFDEQAKGDCPLSKKPSFPTHKAIKNEADKILEFVKVSV